MSMPQLVHGLQSHLTITQIQLECAEEALAADPSNHRALQATTQLREEVEATEILLKIQIQKAQEQSSVEALYRQRLPPSENDDELNQVTIPEELPYHHLGLPDIVAVEKSKIYEFKNRVWVIDSY
jgi:hypothetical protein